MPKLRPSVSFPAITSMSPAIDTAAVARSGTIGTTCAGRSSGGPASDIIVVTPASVDRSTSAAGRRAIVRTMTSASLTSRSRPVIRPVLRKSPSRYADISENRAPTATRAAKSRTPSRSIGLDLLFVNEIRRARAIEQFARNHRRRAPVAAERGHLIEQIAGMARAERPLRRLVVPALEIGHHHRMERHLPAVAIELEDLRELVDGRVDDRDLVGNTAEKRFVGQ